MAGFTLEYQNTLAIQQFANAMYNVQVGSETLDQVLSDVELLGSTDAAFNNYYDFTYGSVSDEDVAAIMVENMGIGADEADDATAYITDILGAAEDKGAAAFDIIQTFSGLEADPVFGAAATAWNAEVDIAMDYDGVADVEAGTEIVVPPETFFMLTADQDIINGSAEADVFLSDVVQVGGLQVNSLGTGDTLKAGDGADFLSAQLAPAATFLNQGSSAYADPTGMAVQPRINSIETIKLEGLNADYDADDFDGDSENSVVFFNAKNVEGVDSLWSWYSDADMVVQDLTTLDSDGSIRPVSDMTIGMGYTGNDGNDDAVDASDLYVYFDQDYLNPEIIRNDISVAYEVMNEDGYDADSAAPLDGVYFDKFVFTLNGTDVDMSEFLQSEGLEDASGDGSEISTYAEAVAALNAALPAAIAANPDLPQLADGVFSLGGSFLTTDGRPGTQVLFTVPGSNAEGGANTLAADETDVYIKDAESTVPNSNRYDVADTFAPTQDQELRVNVALEKVGRAGEGGELVIGSMDSDSHGIQIFDVTVYGDDSKPSDLDELSSTANALQEVYVDTDANVTGDTGYADLTIDYLRDVRVFDASGLKGDLDLYARLSSSIVAKYMDRGDIQADVSADNAVFDYTGGIGNDTFSMELFDGNDDDSGSATREDFVLNIDSGAGNDSVYVQVGSGSYFSDSGYANAAVNDELNITTGTGNDFVNTYGEGDWNISTGSGDDVVYSDNSGNNAVWLVNDATPSESDGLGLPLVTGLLYGAELTVTYSGPTAGMVTDGAAVAFANGYEATVTIPTNAFLGSQQQANQAIKDAINNDPVLSQVLVASDGTDNIVVIDSLVDGVHASTDIDITVAAATLADLSASEQADLQEAYEDLINDSTATLVQADLDAYAAAVETTSAADNVTAGTLAANRGSDNDINLGSGNDVAVLSTDGDSEESLIFTGTDIGDNTIFNFDDDAGDILDFRSYLVDIESASGSVTSQVRVATTVDAATVDGGTNLIDGNEIVFLTGFTPDTAAGETWASMTAADLLAAIEGTDDATDSYGNIDDNTLDAANANADLIVDDYNAVVLIENNANAGEYKVFHVQADDDIDEFTSVDLLGVVDFGATIADATVAVA